MDKTFDLAYELRKCKEYSCSRCVYNGTKACYVELAIKELSRYEQAMDSIRAYADELKGSGDIPEKPIPDTYLDNH